MKLGSLFDGSGGFPLAGVLNGITPVWASEVEPYPIAVTRSRFPEMIHLGDISSVDGSAIEPVDVITFGSPCQDMSIAGKRAGIKNQAVGDDETTRSGLFYEAARIIREMKEATNGRYPSFAVWENVPGAFSSNNGEDFRCVLETLIQIVEPGAVMPPVPKKVDGVTTTVGWETDGALRTELLTLNTGESPSVAVESTLSSILEETVPEKILFERKGMRGDFAEGRTPWKGTPKDSEESPGICDKQVCIPINTMIATRWKELGRGTGFGVGYDGDPQFTISAVHEHAVCTPVTMRIRSGCEGGGKGPLIQKDKSGTLATNNDQYLFVPCVAEQTLADGLDIGVHIFYVVRRMTPTECTRLQGFPDHWGDIAPLDISNNDELFLWKGIYKTDCRINGKKVSASILSTPEHLSKWHSKLQTDSSMYKMWGNGIALPNAAFVMKGIAKVLRVQLLIEQLTGEADE